MYSFLQKILPEGIRSKANNVLNKQMASKRAILERTIPKVDLQDKHIRHLKMLTDRGQLLDLMPKQGIVAEIGVDKGGFSERILQHTSPKRLHLVDVWATERYHEGLMESVKTKFEPAIKAGQVVINRGLSTEVGGQFEDKYFDWIYIDTDHSYALTAAELELYAPKVKTGGIIAGHDFVMGNWVTGFRYGVMEAVYEFCVKNDWEMIYQTVGLTENPSFAIRKI